MKASKITNIGVSVSGWAQGDEKYWTYADNLDCDQADAAFAALTLEQQIAQCKTLTELTALGYSVGTERNCSGFNVTVTTDNSGASSGGSGGGSGAQGWGSGNFVGTALQEVQSDPDKINLVVTQLDTANRRFKFDDNAPLTQDVKYSIDGDVNRTGGGGWYSRSDLAAMWFPMGWPVLVHKVANIAGLPSYIYKNNPNGNQLFEAQIRVK